MKDLERIAKEWFERYSVKETGKRLRWDLLSKNRKLEWMEEVLMVSDIYMKYLQEEVKPVGNLPRGSTSYANGFNEALRGERIRFYNLTLTRHEQLLEEYNEFKIEDKKKRR